MAAEEVGAEVVDGAPNGLVMTVCSFGADGFGLTWRAGGGTEAEDEGGVGSEAVGSGSAPVENGAAVVAGWKVVKCAPDMGVVAVEGKGTVGVAIVADGTATRVLGGGGCIWLGLAC